MSKKSDFITTKEVAEFLNLAEKTVYRMAADGKIPAYKVGASWRFRSQEIEAWLETTKKRGKGVNAAYHNNNTSTSHGYRILVTQESGKSAYGFAIVWRCTCVLS